MDPDHPEQNGICFDGTQVENLVLADSDGEAEILPRIGDEFQVQLPLLIGGFNYISEAVGRTYRNDLLGLPMSLAWISLKHEKLGCDNSSQTSSDHSKLDSKDGILEEISFFGNEPSQLSRNHVEAKKFATAEKMRKCNRVNCILVPESSNDYWSSFETQGFILALYIFEKDFIEVRRFLGTKETGSLLSFYYGNFYGSQAYRRWSDCRKMKGKKGIYGRRLFSGLRQQELLSRVLPRVPEESRNTLVEVSKAFTDEKISLANYVSCLKSVAGMNILVEAVGIGTGKQDLTTMALESSRSSQVIPMRPEIPIGKACSTLTASEIIKFLIGGYRLSKARSNDLFWEAVWPRLLARGWHSEQPNDQGYVAGSKNSLVFLIPEVKIFSRRKLVKGKHYFDSVTDVLSKVAREPGMIRLENEEDDDRVKKEEYAWTSERKMETDYIELPARQKPCFLQPRTPKRSTVMKMKFTVVDTSLSNGNVREIRSLPSEISGVSTAQVFDEDSDEDTPAEASAESGMINSINRKTAKFDKKTFHGKKDENLDVFCQDSGTVYPHGAPALLPGSKKKKDFPKNISKSRKLNQNDTDYMVPTTKRRRVLSACSQDETNSGLHQARIGSRTDEKMSSCCSGPQEVTDNSGSCEDKLLSSTSLCRGRPIESVENSQIHPLVDLNLPHTFPESENTVFAKEQESTSMKMEKSSFPESSATEAITQQQISTNPGRHSTRNRPLTSKAMEALVNGYLTVNRRRNAKEPNLTTSKLSKRTRVLRGPNESTNSPVASQVEEAEHGASNSGNVNASAESQVPNQEHEELYSGHYQLENRIVGEKEQEQSS